MKPYTPYRRTLAWIGFITLYLLTPLALIYGIYLVSQLGVTHYDRDTTLSALHNRD